MQDFKVGDTVEVEYVDFGGKIKSFIYCISSGSLIEGYIIMYREGAFSTIKKLKLTKMMLIEKKNKHLTHLWSIR